MTVLAYSPVLPSVEVFGAYEGIASATAVNQTVSLTFTPTEGTLFVVPYDSDTISQLQLEVGPTPSSYIPTPSSGGTATRGAETLTVAAADLPWPTPRVIGPELITNGTFDTDVSGWITRTFGGASLSSSVTGGKVTISTSVSGYAFITQAFTTVVGKVYQVAGSISSITGGVFTAIRKADDEVGVTNLVTIKSGAGDADQAFRATATTTYIYLQVNAVGSATFDNISVREIDPLSVSIQMDGRMTYADENALPQHEYVRWYSDASNYVRWMFDTQTGTGGPLFRQASGGVVDPVVQYNAYSPGILVPYNLASRHGSTFINGAVDGTALTADNTPVALPDLSATDLNLALDYMGTLRTFRMWAKDLTDAGLEEAST